MDIAIFIDGNNMIGAQKMQGWNIDYERLLNYYKNGNNLIFAYYFTAYNPINKVGYDKFKKALIHFGYNVQDKPTHKVGKMKKAKGNLDIELCVRMLVTYHRWDKGILFGGDMDFIPVVDHLQLSSKTMEVVGHAKMTSIKMRNCAEKFIPLEEMKPIISKQ